MQNIGWDFEVGHQYKIDQVQYNVAFNISTYKNEVVKIISPSYGTTTVQEGLPYGSYYLIEWDGIFQNQAEIDNAPTHPYNPKPGDLKYKDANNDGKINADDRKVVDGAYPKFFYGGTLNVLWKNLDVSLFIQGINGIKNYFGSALHTGYGYVPFVQGSPPSMDLVKNHWTGEGSTNKYPAMYEQSYLPINGTASTYWLLDASYMRLKNLRIGYNVPSATARKIGLKGLQVYLSGDNLFTLSAYPGLDPEKASQTGRYSVYLQLTTYALGIKVKL